MLPLFATVLLIPRVPHRHGNHHLLPQPPVESCLAPQVGVVQAEDLNDVAWRASGHMQHAPAVRETKTGVPVCG